MGFVLLDIEFRAERAFGVRIPRRWPEAVGIVRDGDDATLDALHAYLLRLCEEQHVVPPTESWTRLLEVVVDAAGFESETLTPETRLIRDLAPSG